MLRRSAKGISTAFYRMVDLAFVAFFTKRNMPIPTIPEMHILTEVELERPYLRGKRRRKFVYGAGK